MDKTAPNAQNVCPGYKASNVQDTSSGFNADLTLAGQACNVYVSVAKAAIWFPLMDIGQ